MKRPARLRWTVVHAIAAARRLAMRHIPGDEDAAPLRPITVEVLAIINTWPSADALAVTCAPMLPLAPGRFSITKGLPKRSVSAGEIIRAMMSDEPPGGKVTIRRTGRLG